MTLKSAISNLIINGFNTNNNNTKIFNITANAQGNSIANLIYPVKANDFLVFSAIADSAAVLISAPEVVIPINIHLKSFWYLPERVSQEEVFCTFLISVYANNIGKGNYISTFFGLSDSYLTSISIANPYYNYNLYYINKLLSSYAFALSRYISDNEDVINGLFQLSSSFFDVVFNSLEYIDELVSSFRIEIFTRWKIT